MVVDTTLYEILGVDPECSEEELKKAFKKKAQILHPDKNRDDPDATEKFQELNEAYEVLKNPETRQIYDEYGPDGLKEGVGDGAFTNIFEHLFGSSFGMGGKDKPKTSNIVQPYEATLEELYNGTEAVVMYKRHIICQACKGAGSKSGSKGKQCETCYGKGKIGVLNGFDPFGGPIQSITDCDVCEGFGYIIEEDDKCPVCHGEKLVEEEKEVNIHIERGMAAGNRIVFKGSSNEIPEAETGDLIINIEEKPHPVFSRRNDDLLIKKQITLYEALFGIGFSVQTLDGRTLVVERNPDSIIQFNEVRVIDGEGMPIKSNPFEHGKLFIQFEIILPQTERLSEGLKRELALIQPPVNQLEGIDLNGEGIFVKGTNNSEIEEFTQNQKSQHDHRSEAYNQDEYYDEDFEEDGNTGGIGCQPM